MLILLYEHDDVPHVVLTRRAAHLRHHAHEVSFPGGRHDASDDDLWATALREAAEEIALVGDQVRPAGRLDSFITVGSGSLICPFVGVVDERPRLTPSPAEVEAIIHVPLHELLLDVVWREELWTLGSGPERTITFFELEGDTVWGATAAILRQLLAVVTGTDERIPGGPP